MTAEETTQLVLANLEGKLIMHPCGCCFKIWIPDLDQDADMSYRSVLTFLNVPSRKLRWRVSMRKRCGRYVWIPRRGYAAY
jgi:hypothetical protein